MLLKIEAFKGVMPRIEPHLLPANAAQVAKNCRLDSGSIRPLKTTTTINTPSKVGTKKTIYRWGGSYWFHWLADVDVVRGPIADDAAEVTYFTGDGAPKVTDSSIAVQGGGTDYPTNAYALGVPVPGSAPVAGVVGESTDPTQAEDRAYVVTMVAMVSAVEMEGPPSPVSGIVTVEPAQTVDLTLPAAPSGNFDIIKKRIYRTANAGTPNSTEYLFVAEVLAATTAYNDAVATNMLGSAIQSTTWDGPPADLHSLKLHPGGFMVGVSGMDLCVSVPYQPHAWPYGWRIKMDYPIVGLGIYGTTIVVLTTATPYLVTGTSPDSLLKERTEIRQACVSKRGIVDLGYATAFPSPDGLWVVGLGVSKNATAALMKRSDWQALNPSSITGAFHDGRYYGFFDNGTPGGFILDPETEDLTFIDTHATAAFTDPVEDVLYLQVGNDIVGWEQGAAAKTATWRSKLVRTPRPINPAVGQVFADSYPLTFRLYAGGVSVLTATITSRMPFWLPEGYLDDMFEVEIEGTARIDTVYVAESLAELRSA